MDVSLREITAENRAAVEALAVAPHQDGYVAGVADSLAEAAELPEAAPWYRAVYAGDTPVGFVMINDGFDLDEHPDWLGPYCLWRLLVDARHQGRGYGAAAVRLVADHVRGHPDAQVLFTSVVPGGPACPLPFYLGLGFRDTGRLHDDELVLELPLRAGRVSSAG
jgi:diamine N-acetyltransferase